MKNAPVTLSGVASAVTGDWQVNRPFDCQMIYVSCRVLKWQPHICHQDKEQRVTEIKYAITANLQIVL